jgi:hypothetical protein
MEAGAQVFSTVLNTRAGTGGDQPAYYAYYGSPGAVPGSALDGGLSLRTRRP